MYFNWQVRQYESFSLPPVTTHTPNRHTNHTDIFSSCQVGRLMLCNIDFGPARNTCSQQEQSHWSVCLCVHVCMRESVWQRETTLGALKYHGKVVCVCGKSKLQPKWAAALWLTSRYDKIMYFVFSIYILPFFKWIKIKKFSRLFSFTGVKLAHV